MGRQSGNDGFINICWRSVGRVWHKQALQIVRKLNTVSEIPSPHIIITYCSQCNWMLRSAWMAQEILSTFSQEVGAVTLVPGTGGTFTITCAGETVWDRKEDGGFPEAKILKQRLRDRLWPEMSLGHSDRNRDADQ